MHDNAKPHVARICRHFLNRNKINVLPWPAVSTDMNPIEHILDYLGRTEQNRYFIQTCTCTSSTSHTITKHINSRELE